MTRLEELRTLLLLFFGLLALVLAFVPHLRPAYLTAAGGLLGFDPVYRGARKLGNGS